MCSHHNIVKDEYGTTCADCYTYFAKSFCAEGTEYTSCHNGPSFQSKSTFCKNLERFGICDQNVSHLAQEIFNRASKNKIVKGSNKLSIMCASVYYAYFYLNNPKNFEDILAIFNINHKIAIKGLKNCQVALQEHPLDQGRIYAFTTTHKENLKNLMKKYSIPIHYYDDIENIIVVCHQKKKKILSDKINNLWISGIFFWISKFTNLDPEEFVSMNENITLQQLKTDITYIRKILKV
ncbi:hypothetical protein DH26_gp071 [Chloriridovirus anopheles1]|uniref:Transcription factor TFIIB cyclin-like domain-containing protein n=1 Tax=Chloriridovirus anopheles1 TaxID=1465751 RepID=W8QF27_9VIRU|nr:hypothetical protein DH26_gp071 [Anopheles minimus iridovirus]AHL67564.1 hypothetical protein AMIV_071 [Anopheles minimus iridovirus]